MTRAFRHFENINRSRHQYQVISDAIYFTCSDREAVDEFLGHLRSIFIAFLEEGLLIRGGVTFGQHFMNNSITYSPALTSAYELESTTALFPRIMVNDNIPTMFPHLVANQSILKSGRNWFLAVANTDNWHKLWQHAKSIAQTDAAAINGSEQIRIKHKWLQDHLVESASIFEISCPHPYIGTSDLFTSSIVARKVEALHTLARVLEQVAMLKDK